MTSYWRVFAVLYEVIKMKLVEGKIAFKETFQCKNTISSFNIFQVSFKKPSSFQPHFTTIDSLNSSTNFPRYFLKNSLKFNFHSNLFHRSLLIQQPKPGPDRYCSRQLREIRIQCMDSGLSQRSTLLLCHLFHCMPANKLENFIIRRGNATMIYGFSIYLICIFWLMLQNVVLQVFGTFKRPF